MPTKKHIRSARTGVSPQGSQRCADLGESTRSRAISKQTKRTTRTRPSCVRAIGVKPFHEANFRTLRGWRRAAYCLGYCRQFADADRLAGRGPNSSDRGPERQRRRRPAGIAQRPLRKRRQQGAARCRLHRSDQTAQSRRSEVQQTGRRIRLRRHRQERREGRLLRHHQQSCLLPPRTRRPHRPRR